MVLRARLELASRPALQCTVSRPGIGGILGIAARRAQAAVIAVGQLPPSRYSTRSRRSPWRCSSLATAHSRGSAFGACHLGVAGDGRALRHGGFARRALSAQSLQPHRLIVAVESAADPAHPRVAALAQHYPRLNIELIVAGLSSLRSQKCTNLLAALARLRPDDAMSYARCRYPATALVACGADRAAGSAARRYRQRLSLAGICGSRH